MKPHDANLIRALHDLQDTRVALADLRNEVRNQLARLVQVHGVMCMRATDSDKILRTASVLQEVVQALDASVKNAGNAV